MTMTFGNTVNASRMVLVLIALAVGGCGAPGEDEELDSEGIEETSGALTGIKTVELSGTSSSIRFLRGNPSPGTVALASSGGASRWNFRGDAKVELTGTSSSIRFLRGNPSTGTVALVSLGSASAWNFRGDGKVELRGTSSSIRFLRGNPSPGTVALVSLGNASAWR